MATILLVDGDRKYRSTCARDLEREGHQVLTSPNGFEVMHLVSQRRPEVVVTELFLPGSCARELIHELLGRTPRPLSVLNSASSYRRDPFLSWAADAELRKSDDTTELRRTLAALLKAQRRPQDDRPAAALPTMRHGVAIATGR